jgi:hypothetical protein
MATLQNTTVPDNGYYRVGTTNTAYVSSGGAYAHFGLSAWFDGTSWSPPGGPVLQLTTSQLNFYMNPYVSGTPTFSTAEAVTTVASTTTTINGALGVGAAASTGKILVNAGGTSTPFLEVTNCLGDGRVVSTYPTFSGYLGIKIGSSVGPSTSVAAGTYYIRLWDK